MLGLHVLHLRLLEVEQAITIPAVMVIGTLPVMLFTRIGAPEIEVAIIAWPVGIGILFVLLQCPVTWERSFTAITIRHRMIVVRSKEGGWSNRLKPDIKIYINCGARIPPGGTHPQARRRYFLRSRCLGSAAYRLSLKETRMVNLNRTNVFGYIRSLSILPLI